MTAALILGAAILTTVALSVREFKRAVREQRNIEDQ